MTDNPTSIFDELSDRPKRQYPSQKPPRQQKSRTRNERPAKTPTATASPESSDVAQRWVDAALNYGLRVPYNANFFATRLSARVVTDERMRPLLRAGKTDQVTRWLNKMTELFWREWVQESDTASNVANVYLDEAWEDVRDYALDSLRAKYLKEHGRTVPAPDYLPHTESEMHRLLGAVRVEEWLEQNVAASGQEIRESRKLDVSRKQVLLSALDNRRTEREEG